MKCLQHVFSSGLGAMSPARIVKWPGCNVSSTYCQVAWVQCLQHVLSSGLGAMSPTRILKWPGCNVSSTYSQVAWLQSLRITYSRSSAYHVQYVMCHLMRRDSSAIKFDRVEIAFILALFYWLKPLPDKEGMKPEYSEKTPYEKPLQKMPQTNDWNFKPQPRLEPTLWHWWQVRKADVLATTPHTALIWRVKHYECMIIDCLWCDSTDPGGDCHRQPRQGAGGQAAGGGPGAPPAVPGAGQEGLRWEQRADRQALRKPRPPLPVHA